MPRSVGLGAPDLDVRARDTDELDEGRRGRAAGAGPPVMLARTTVPPLPGAARRIGRIGRIP
ncbi:MAG: hypothetical protein QOH08_2550 [Chloroflexota bacterium]|nr:hypothetical protein [Chloroflexota bacterium]